MKDNTKTRMTTFIKTKLKISDIQKDITKYRVATNITEYHIISKLLFGHNYRVAMLFTLYLTVSRITIPSFKSIGQF